MNIKVYFYFIGVTIFFPLWFYLFLRKDKRKDMLFTGILMGIAATIIEYLYAKLDYWKPVYLIPNFPFEDFYYGFIFGGISSEFYEIFLKLRNSKKRVYPTHKKIVILLILITGFSFWFFVNLMKLNSIVAHIIPFLFIGSMIMIIRKDLAFFEIVNGFLVALITFLMFKILLFIYPEIFYNHWLLNNLSGIFFLGIPIEEILFAFSVGFGMSCIYELSYGYGEVKEK